MTNSLFTIITIIVLIFGLCAVIFNTRSGKTGNKKKGNTFSEARLCPNCKVGRQSYELDKHSDSCRYITCWVNGECPFFQPIETITSEKASKRALKQN